MQRKEKHRKPKRHTRVIKFIPVNKTTYTCWCQECDQPFQATRNDALTCSNRCRSRRFRRIAKERRELRQMQEIEPLFYQNLYSDDDPASLAIPIGIGHERDFE